ncbi:MAG: recombinase family protein [Loktanella sp.]|nr:recombinase family protein [Loktanella sp.]
MTEIINAYSYLRISTEKQKFGDGIRRQLDASKAYAEREGYNLIETMSDIGVSAFKGKNSKEGALGIFIDAINEGKVPTGSVLLVESLDRLSRDNVLSAFAQFTSILNKGVGIVTLTDEQHYTADSVSQNVGQLFTSLGIMLRANEESVIKSRRIKAAWQRKRDNILNLKLTSTVPSWLYLNEDKTEILIDEEKAKLVRQIFDLSINGMGLYSITRHLNADLKKYPPISNAEHWNHSYINKILSNTATFGRFQPQETLDGSKVAAGNVIEDYYPAVVTENTFRLAQSRRLDRNIRGSGRKGDTFSNLFTTIVKCGTCGATIGLKNKGTPPKGFKYLRCNHSVANKGCFAPSWRYNEFEDAFIQFVREVKFSELVSDGKAEQENLAGQKAAKVEQLVKDQSAYNALLSQFENADLPQHLLTSLIARSNVLQANIEEHQQAISDLEIAIAQNSRADVDTEQADFLAAYEAIQETGDAEQLKEIRYAMNALLKRTIEVITVYNDFELFPWEVPDVLSSRLLTSLGKMSQDKMETYFSKPHGKRAYIESERYFVIKFKSGSVRVVQPYENKTYLSVSERLAAMKSRKRD